MNEYKYNQIAHKVNIYIIDLVDYINNKQKQVSMLNMHETDKLMLEVYNIFLSFFIKLLEHIKQYQINQSILNDLQIIYNEFKTIIEDSQIYNFVYTIHLGIIKLLQALNDKDYTDEEDFIWNI